MLRWLARFVLFRIMPRWFMPVLTVVELARLLSRSRRVRVNDPRRSRTGPPPRPGDAPARPRSRPPGD